MKKIFLFFLGTWKRVFFIYMSSIIVFSFIYLHLFKKDQNNFNFLVKEESKKWDTSSKGVFSNLSSIEKKVSESFKDIEKLNTKIDKMYVTRSDLYIQKNKILDEIKKDKEVKFEAFVRGQKEELQKDVSKAASLYKRLGGVRSLRKGNKKTKAAYQKLKESKEKLKNFDADIRLSENLKIPGIPNPELQSKLKNLEDQIEQSLGQEKEWMGALHQFHGQIESYKSSLEGFGSSVKNVVKENIVYIDILYFSVITATTTGYGDITPRSSETRFYVLIQILFSIFVFGLGLERFCYENFGK